MGGGGGWRGWLEWIEGCGREVWVGEWMMDGWRHVGAEERLGWLESFGGESGVQWSGGWTCGWRECTLPQP